MIGEVRMSGEVRKDEDEGESRGGERTHNLAHPPHLL